MKTWQAFLAQLATSAAQLAVGTQFFNPVGIGQVFGNVGIQLGAQTALTTLQWWIAKKNSETDPKGNPLAQDPLTDQYKSVK